MPIMLTPPDISARPDVLLVGFDDSVQSDANNGVSDAPPGAGDLIRSQFPKGTDLSGHSADEIAAVAAALNTRPRKTLEWKTPAEALDELLDRPTSPLRRPLDFALAAAIAAVHEPAALNGPPIMESLLQCIEHEARMCCS